MLHTRNIIQAGQELSKAAKAIIMIHGRGGSAEDILSLATHLKLDEFALIAPQASGGSWYPFSFLAPPVQNEPGLSSALSTIHELVTEIKNYGIPTDKIYFLGFSQGACLTLEFVTRNATRYGGVIAFTGGLIGDQIYLENYKGDFNSTPVFIGTSDPDPHVPVDRVQASSDLLKKMNASVTLKVYNNMGHTISQDEIDLVNTIVF